MKCECATIYIYIYISEISKKCVEWGFVAELFKVFMDFAIKFRPYFLKNCEILMAFELNLT